MSIQDSLRGALPLQDGLWLGQANGRLVIKGETQELLLSDQLCYVPRLGSDELRDGKLSWKIESGERDAICELIARHRLNLEIPAHSGKTPDPHIFLESPYPWWNEWLAAGCEEKESLLCALSTGDKREIASAYDSRESVEAFLVWTTTRVFFAYAGRLGDVEVEPLTLPLGFESGLRRDYLLSSQARFPVGSRNRKAIAAMTTLMAEPPSLWRAGISAMILGEQGPVSAKLLAERASFIPDPALGLMAPLWGAKGLAPDPDAEVWGQLVPLWGLIQNHAKIPAQSPAPVALDQIDGWLETLSLEALANDRCFEHPWPLGRWLAHLAETVPQAQKGELLALLELLGESEPEEKDIGYVETWLGFVCVRALLCEGIGAIQEAQALLMRLIDALPSAADLELLLGQEDEQAPLRHLLDALVQRALSLWPKGAQARPALLETRASLAPLCLERLDGWLAAGATQSSDEQYKRVQLVRAQLSALTEIRAQTQAIAPLPQKLQHALSQTQIDTRLVHPAARTSHTGAVQAMLAKLEMPDHSALKKYCDPGQEGVLSKEVELVASVFDKAPVDVFISHGERRYGVMAYEGEPSFVLVGGEHRRPESPAFLAPAQLRFTLGSELAHLYLGHSRVTSQEVLSGAWDKGKATFEVLTSLVPFLSAFPWGKRLGKWTGYLDNRLVSRSAQRVREYFGEADSSAAQLFTLDRSVGLIAAHRMMQLTADRAGLLLCGDLGEAILAMWKLRPQSVAYLEMLSKEGLLPTIEAMAAAGVQEWRILSTRAAALTSFAWSQEYEELRRSVWGYA